MDKIALFRIKAKRIRSSICALKLSKEKKFRSYQEMLILLRISVHFIVVIFASSLLLILSLQEILSCRNIVSRVAV